jgi:hypothetical protein
MSSESKQSREAQKAAYQRAIQSRRNLLVERGVDKERIPKDARLRHLRAELRRTMRRVRALQALERKKEEMALLKAQKLQAKQEETPADLPEESKKKEKKEKKKEKKPEPS